MHINVKIVTTLLIFCLRNQFFIKGQNTGPKHGKLVVCYLGTWSVYRPDRGSFTIENLDPSLCTHLIYSFVGLNSTDNTVKSLDPWQDLTDNYGKGGFQRMTNLRLKYPHIKISLAIGGWNEGSANYSRMSSESSRRSQFVTSALQFIKKYNFDGLDLDWEFPGKRDGAPEDKRNFLLLVKELRAAFRKHQLLLTAAFGAGKDTIDVAYDVEPLANYLDFIHMMCYDYHGAWDSKTGINSPLRSVSNDVLNVEYTINYMIKLGAPVRKLVMGIPLYGRTFKLPNSPLESIQSMKNNNPQSKLGIISTNEGFQGPYTKENGFMGFNEICLELNNKTEPVWQRFWDDVSSTPFAIRQNQFISYDDKSSIGKKVQFAMEKNLAGVMVWSIDTDDFHGDCDEMPFPLMHGINDAIKISLEDIKNRIIKEKQQELANTGSSIINKIDMMYSMIILGFSYLLS